MRLIVGPPNSGKIERVLSRLAEVFLNARGRALLIVPSTSAGEVVFDRLQSLLRGKQGRLPAVKTFPGLYTDILSDAGINLHPLRKIERDRLLRQAIASLADEKRLSYFADIATSPGTVSSLSSLIEELWRSGTDPQRFARFAQERGAKDRDIASAFERYAEMLASRHAVDSEGAGLRAARALETRHRSSLNFSLVAACGFDFYTAVQTRLLLLLSRLGVETLATLTYQQGRAVHLWQNPTRKRFQDAEVETEELSDAPAHLIRRAAARLLADDPSRDWTPPADSPIAVISAPDRATEVRAAAREIKRLLLEGRCSTDDITVVCRSLALYAHHLEQVFSECGLAVTIDSPAAVNHSPAVISLMRLFSVSSRRFQRRAVMSCLRSPFFDLSRFGLDEKAIDLIDLSSIEGNVTGERQQWMEAVRGATKNRRGIDYTTENDASFDERREAAAAGLENFFDEIALPASAPARAHARKALSLIASFEVEAGIKRGQEHQARTSALEAFRSLLEEIEKDENETEIDSAMFIAELERAVSAATVARPSVQGPSVIAQEVHNLRPRPYRAVFLLGLIEGEFPARATERFPYTLLEREELRREGIDLTETTADAGADVTGFYKAMSAAGERLYLSYERTDPAGGQFLRSYLIDEVESVASVREIFIPQQRASFDRMSEIISLEELALAAARSMRDGFDSKDMLAARRRLEKESKSWAASVRSAQIERGRLEGTGRAKFRGVIEDEEAMRKGLKADHLWSASQMNDYGSCPFRFFARHVLKLAPVEEPVEGFVATLIGTAYHKILEQTHCRLKESGLRISSPQCVAVASEVVEETLEEMAREGEIRKGIFWEFEKAEIRRNVLGLLEKEAEWNSEQESEPVAFEQKFGFKGTPEMVIERDGRRERLCGVIDRIDRTEDGWVVIDYKTTRTPIHHREALEGRNLQLPIYLMAASRLNREAKVAAGYYLHITSRKKGSEVPRSDDERLTVEAMIAEAERRIFDYAVSARAGRFPVSPSNEGCCQGCRYEVMCRINSM
jgi:ATP-dependent helicase/DNAse subunit B